MKKILLAVITVFILSFNGIAQCGSMINPYVFVHQNAVGCYGQMADFVINYYGGGSNPTFKFYKSYSTFELSPFQYNLSGGSYPFLMIMDPNIQSFTIEMTSSDPCASVPKVTTSVNINRLPIININIGDGNSKTVCATDGFALKTTPNTLTQYTKYMFPELAYSNFSWYKDGTLIPNATDSVYTPTSSGQYYMHYFFSTNSSGGTCNTFYYNVTINDCMPFSTSISGSNTIIPGQQNTTYSVSNQTGFIYAWTVTGGTIVSGQNTNSITVDWSTSAPYSISLVEKNQSSQQQTITKVINTITTSTTLSQAQSGIKLFPNPTRESFNIEMPESGVDVSYEILDLSGLSVSSGTFVSTGNDQNITTDFSAGMYQVILKYNNSVTCIRLSKVQ